ncbi:AbrB family transcriptional regulator [Roseomonas gilardii subsp. gilardii]|uniref:AbrB family transcriptional regulator n=1 Tax=Roseomonas gilardii TaxID=257708 RepID=UPI001FFB2115|nr:AbrB family transcriptional regulator [Roseomonas gilardii]UPG72215.1 AbrB family transcriptional regulator [Roseomonas gilardii subsp. gilardii]
MTRQQVFPPSTKGLLSRLPVPASWALLVLLSAVLAGGLMTTGLPAALLLGPMVAAILVAVGGAALRMPKFAFTGVQGIVGTLVAVSITAEIIHTFLSDWPLFLGVVLSTLAASSVLGWLMSRWGVLPGTTAVWGSTPGAASAMVLMAQAFGADARLVAFMQYLRVAFVAVAASLIARIWVDTSGAQAPALVWFPPLAPVPFLGTLLVAFGGGALGQWSRIPAGALLVPMLIGAVLHATGLLEIQLPEWLLAASYAVLGWRIGLSFTRAVLMHALRAMPRIAVSILLLMGFCGGLAALLTHVVGIDPLTAYLATSPGGIDSVAVIAASSQVDLSFVMALQAIRLVIVILLGPVIARLVARHGGMRDVPVV